jgi:hypothetical protein
VGFLGGYVYSQWIPPCFVVDIVDMWAHAQPVTGHAPLRLSDLDLPSAPPGAAHRGPDKSNLKASEPLKGTTTDAIRVTFLDTTDDDSTRQHDDAGTTESPNVEHGPHQRIAESIQTVASRTALAGQELPPTTSPETNNYSHATHPVWPPPRRESLMNRSPTPWVCFPAFAPALHALPFGTIPG